MAVTATPEFQVFYESLGYGVTKIPSEVDVIVPGPIASYGDGVEFGTGSSFGGVDPGENVVIGIRGPSHNVRSQTTYAQGTINGGIWDVSDYESFQYLVTSKVAKIKDAQGNYIFHIWRGSPGLANLEAAKAQIAIMGAELAAFSGTTPTTAGAPATTPTVPTGTTPTATGGISVKVNTGPLFPQSQGRIVTGVLRADGDTVDFSDGSIYSWRNTILPGATAGYVTILSGPTVAPSVPVPGAQTPGAGITPPSTSQGVDIVALGLLALGLLGLSALLFSGRRRRA